MAPVAGLLLLLAGSGVAGQAAPAPAQLADPFLGVDGGGNTVPGAAVPFGFIELSPETEYPNTSGYSSRGRILGFAHTHVSGTGGDSKYGNFLVVPTCGALALGNLAFAKADERAAPGYYAVTLRGEQGAVRAELTASRRVGVSRFTFPPAAAANVILDVSAHTLQAQRATHARATVEDGRHVSGSAAFRGGWNPAPYTLYFYAEFDRPAARLGTWTSAPGSWRVDSARHVEGDQTADYRRRVGVYATFAGGAPVEMKLAVSFVSVEQARRTLREEAPGDFDAARGAAARAWDDIFARIRVEGGTDTQRRLFYSSLLRAHYMPHDLSGENVWWTSSEPHYEDFYTLWDTFRTLHPLLTLIEPDRQRDMVRSLVDTYRHTGWLPDARIAGTNGLTQGGSNGDVVVADAIVKGLQGIDYATAYQALQKDADVQSPDPLNQGRELGDYLRLGYMSLSSNRSASRTLEYAADDFAVAQVARALGHAEDARRYQARSASWSELWDARLRCIRPRYADGAWLENYSCEHVYPDFTTEWWDTPFYEGSGIQYSTYVPHDVRGLMERVGGDSAFVAWLDEIFDRGLYDPTNEPDLLAPWLYIHAGRPDRTAERVRTLLATAYHPGRDGLPGNDDAGTMTSWYVWSALGLFPNAGQPLYYIGSPVFLRTTIQLGSGRSFIIEALGTSDADRYVVAAELNGKPLERAWLTHAELAAGGRLVLHMAPAPSRWGRAERP
ncbi:MAG TPA: GH92 family glycosyl hydrolase, partial [Longimicrobiales bacterium]